MRFNVAVAPACILHGCSYMGCYLPPHFCSVGFDIRETDFGSNYLSGWV